MEEIEVFQDIVVEVPGKKGENQINPDEEKPKKKAGKAEVETKDEEPEDPPAERRVKRALVARGSRRRCLRCPRP